MMISKFIDAHVHLNTTSIEKMELALKYNASFLSINTNIPFFESITNQKNIIQDLQSKYPGRIQFITSFDFRNWGKENFASEAIQQIEAGLNNGAVGVKIWKDVGFELHDKEGNFVMIDDPVFDPIFEYLIENDILLIGHQGEPRNCWLPLEEMTVDSDRNYFREHPEYHMYLQKEYPSYEQQMKARDNMLKKFPQLRYVGLHLFSMEYNINEVAKRLEIYPNTKTDVAERVVHLQLQAIGNWEGVRDFCIKYQDKIMYGTDVIDDGTIASKEISERFEHLWNFHYDFFATNKTMEAPEFKGKFKGLQLPKEVVKKIFYSNAKKTYQFD
ncbi:amidohydrolase family protein [Autumnicola musiva]|uniref:Amidohydrolase family protein n=1 Tax=Autumnicola musiva TaxID=3075589 RepID=A0ABU3DAK1_9FLAO|nr:amidohydrolase family protein [Zunongwangia sp. F117]MDT0678571.1 amidohydrolase family protein [Zunongwangia sp. F117]